MTTCPRCQRDFACACLSAQTKACWCVSQPVLKITTQAELARAERGCYCPQCYDDLLRQQQDQPDNRADPA